MWNKGYTMIDALFVIFLMSMILFLVIPISRTSLNDEKNYIQHIEHELINLKLTSMKNLKRLCFETSYLVNSHQLCYNQKGNPSQANTYNLIKSEKQFVIHLGSGVYEIKER